MVSLADIDFMSGRREFDEMESADVELYKPDTKWQKLMSILF
jgi:amino acid transporter